MKAAVRFAIVLACVVAPALAHADALVVATDDPPPPPPPTVRAATAADDDAPPNRLGFRGVFGAVPIGAQTTGLLGLGLAVEHPVFGPTTRVLAEYELLWALTETSSGDPAMPPPMFTGTAHRAHLGVRTTLADTTAIAGKLRLFVDGEVGGGLGMATLPARVAIVPHAFAGVRAGYDLHGRRGMFGFELYVRALAVPDGLGASGGLAFTWGG